MLVSSMNYQSVKDKIFFKETSDKSSRTVPDCTYSIKEMFEMYRRGIPIPDVKTPLLADDEDVGVTEDNFDELDEVAINGVRDLTDLDE